MPRFRPDVKPPQWGPNSAVAFAVRENAQKVLGANPVACLPLWERGFRTQVFDVFGNTVSANGVASPWDAYGYYTESVSGHGILLSLSNSIPNVAFTAFLATRRILQVNFRDFMSVGVDSTYRATISQPATDGNVISYGNGTGYAGNSAELYRGSSLDFTAAIVFNRAASLRTVYVNGAKTTVSFTASAEGLNRVRLGNRVGDDTRPINSSHSLCAVFDTVLSDNAAMRLNYEPYTLLMPVARPLYFDLGASAPPDITGTLSVTESGTDSFAATGQLLISGLMSATEAGSDTIAASGQVLIQGTLSATEAGSDTFAAYGGSISPITGTMAVTETGHDTATIIGQLLISGLMDVSEVGDDVFAAIGSALPSITGDMAVSEAGSDIFAAIGVVTDTAPITAAEVARTVSAIARMRTVRYEIARS